MGNVIRTLQDQQQDPHAVAPGLVRAYNMLLLQQNQLFAEQTDALSQAQRNEFFRLEQASIQFASETKLALEFVKMTAEQRLTDQGKQMQAHRRLSSRTC